MNGEGVKALLIIECFACILILYIILNFIKNYLYLSNIRCILEAENMNSENNLYSLLFTKTIHYISTAVYYAYIYT